MDQKHHFNPGDRVTVSAQGAGARPRGTFLVISRLPAEGGDSRYRIKSDLEQHERVIGESRLALVK